MYICVCNKVTDKQIRHAITNGISTMDQLSDQLQVAACCGRCRDCANRLLGQTLAEGWHDGGLAAVPA